MNMFIVACICGLCLSLCTIQAQTVQPPPCLPKYTSITFPVTRFTTFPPLNSGMPLDVLVGYIVYDSLTRAVSYAQIEEAVQRQMTYGDTLQYAMKYWYEMADYNPLVFHQFQNNAPLRKIIPYLVTEELLPAIRRISASPLLDAMLCEAGIIAHVRATDRIVRTDSAAGWAKTANIITATIIDPIKGRQVPSCISLYAPAAAVPGGEEIVPVRAGICLQFDYRSEWSLTGNEFGREIGQADRQPWIREREEYIVFLRPDLVCRSELQDYFMLRPISRGSMSMMYPVIDGKVLDPNNDFGFGTGLTVEEFKGKLRERIEAILHP